MTAQKQCAGLSRDCAGLCGTAAQHSSPAVVDAFAGLVECTCGDCARTYGAGECPGFVDRDMDGGPSRRIHRPDQVHWCRRFLAMETQP